jgi:hypothetical protein
MQLGRAVPVFRHFNPARPVSHREWLLHAGIRESSRFSDRGQCPCVAGPCQKRMQRGHHLRTSPTAHSPAVLPFH